MILKM